MSRQWVTGDLRPLRDAMADWIGEVCEALAPDPPLRLKTVITKLTDTGFESKRVPELDLVAVGFAARDLGDRAPAFQRVWQLAAERRDVFDHIPAVDDARSAESLREQREWASSDAAEPILRAYVERAGGLRFERALFDEVFDQAERDLRSASSPCTVYAPIGQLTVVGDDPIEVLPGVFVRAATSSDREKWLNRQNVGPLEHMAMLDVQTVLETRFDEPKEPPGATRGARRAQEMIETLETALQLALNCDAHNMFVQFHRDAIFGTPFGGTVSPGPRGGRTSGQLRHSDVATVRDLFGALKSSVNLTQCEIALRRWDDVCARGRDEDRIVDSWVGLESLLFSEESTGELTHRASVRLAVLIGRDATERQDLMRDIRRSYAIRSQVVHGANLKKIDLPVAARTARDYLRRAIVAVLRVPTNFDPKQIDVDLVAAGWTRLTP